MASCGSMASAAPTRRWPTWQSTSPIVIGFWEAVGADMPVAEGSTTAKRRRNEHVSRQAFVTCKDRS
eukprot:7363340-Prymnesium_polylepis.1